MPRKYKRVQVKDNPERQIVLGMVVNDKYIQHVQSILRTDLIETPFILTVIRWCQDFYLKFNSAPGVHIEDIYDKEVENGNVDEDQEALIADLLASISEEYERAESFNFRVLLDQTEMYFEGRNLKIKADNIKLSLSKGDVRAAQQEVLEYSRIALPESKGVNPFTDREAMGAAFEEAAEPLFKVPGAAGKFLNDLFIPEGFVTLLGPEKRGKTWMLIELSIWARRAGCNVAFFCAGDMTLPQMQVRYGIRFTGRSNKPKYCGELKVPCLDCYHNQDDSCESPKRTGSTKVMNEDNELIAWEEAEDHTPCTHCKGEPDSAFKPSSWYSTRGKVKVLDGASASQAAEILDKRWGRKSRLLISAHQNFTLSVAGMRHQLRQWKEESNFIPQVIITDYMDLLVGDGMQKDFRHSINQIWGEYRGLMQEYHALGISASQSDAASYYAKWLSLKNFSDDKRKFSHVTGMITLNQLPEEKRRGVMRLGQLAVREDAYDEKNFVTILQSLAQGKPLLRSY